ncbi:MAG: hypothetical protein ACI9WS_003036, partial [Paraglaciecola psychrophila]
MGDSYSCDWGDSVTMTKLKQHRHGENSATAKLL